MIIDIDKLKYDLIDYLGTSGNPIAYMIIDEINMASAEVIIKVAKDNGFNLKDYEIKTLKF